MSLVIIGSLAFDTIETPFERRERIVGGSGTYCALAASFFTRPKVVGVVGKDFPRKTIELLESRKIDLRGLQIKPGKTFHWEGRYGSDPNQRTTIRTDLNVFRDFNPELPPSYRKADIVFLANIDPDLAGPVLAQLRERPALVALDTIRFWIETKPEALFRTLGGVDVFFANDEEVKLLAGEANLIKAGRRLLGRGPRIIIVKKGEHGALVFSKDFLFGVLAHPCEDVVDPTGAGDSFAGGFLGALDKAGRHGPAEIRRAAVFGSVIASFAIEDFGIERFKTLTRREIEERYKEFKRLVSF
jgi:sugar/nucleoside kinase (ribokinase family)